MVVLVDSKNRELNFFLVVASIDAVNVGISLEDFRKGGCRWWCHVVVIRWGGRVSYGDSPVVFFWGREDADVPMVVKKFCMGSHLMVKLLRVCLGQRERDQREVIVGVDGEVVE